MTDQELKSKLGEYLPAGALDYCFQLFKQETFRFRISPDRKSRYGDFRPGRTPHELPAISVNGSLNSYAFLVTFLHEVAHLKVWQKYKNTVLPHGTEWKNAFKVLLQEMIGQGVFPPVIVSALHDYLKNPAASSSNDTNLYKALRQFDAPDSSKPLLEELPFDSHFQLENGKVFIKKEKLRKFYRCEELDTGREYRVSPIAEVLPLEKVKAQPSKASSELSLSQIPTGSIFQLSDGRQFRKKEKLRTYFRCEEIATGKEFRIGGAVKVIVVG